MQHPLDGARLKVVRAQEHLNALKVELRPYLDTHPYVITRKKYADGKVYPHPEMTTEPPLRLSGIIGDIVSNVRAPLDYIAWQLAVRHFKDPVIDEDRDRRWVSFPIYKDLTDEGFLNKINRFTNRKIPTDAINEIKSVQPCDRRYGALWWLHELVNMDKHRMPHLTVTEFGAFFFVSFPGGGFGLPRMSHHLNTEGDGVVDTMEMQAQNPFYVAFDDAAMPDEPVDRTLEKIIETVANVIPRFDRFFV